jgi:hypothetical protein
MSYDTEEFVTRLEFIDGLRLDEKNAIQNGQWLTHCGYGGC